jgi:hypothetical protein
MGTQRTSRAVLAVATLLALASLGVAGFGERVYAAIGRHNRLIALAAIVVLIAAAQLGARRARRRSSEITVVEQA